MTRKLILTLAALALATFAFASCGDEEESLTGTIPESPLSTDETTTAAAGPNPGKGGTVEIVADPNGNLDYETGDLDTKAGVVEIMFTNEASLGHDVIIENDAGEALGGTEVISGQSTVTDIELDPGTYTYFCSVANHRSEGMQQTLTVKK